MLVLCQYSAICSRFSSVVCVYMYTLYINFCNYTLKFNVGCPIYISLLAEIYAILHCFTLPCIFTQTVFKLGISWLHSPDVIRLKKVFKCLFILILPCRVVTYKTGKSLADSWKAAFFESSAKENSVRIFLNSFNLLYLLPASSRAPVSSILGIQCAEKRVAFDTRVLKKVLHCTLVTVNPRHTSCMTSISENQMNIRIPLSHVRHLNGMLIISLEIFLKKMH